MRFALRHALLVAAAAHVALWASLAHRPRATDRAASAPPDVTIAIEPPVDTPVGPPSPAPPSAVPGEPRRGAPASSGIAERSAVDRGAHDARGGSPSAPEMPGDGAAAGAEGWSASRFVNRPPDLAASAATTRAFAAREADRAADDRASRSALGMRETLHDRDVALGLARGGPVVAVLEEAARSVATPVDGAASLEATFDAQGALVEARVVEASGPRGAWDAVARVLKERFGRQRLRVPPGAKGLRVALRVEAKLQLPNGGDPMPMQVCVPPLPCASTPGHPNRRRVTLSPIPPFFAMPLDPTDLAPASRVVLAHVVREDLL